MRINQLRFYADDINLLDENLNTTKDGSGTRVDTNEEAGLEAKAEETIPRNCTKAKHLGTTVTNKYYIHKEIQSRLNYQCLLPFNSESFALPFPI
jgi:hypothetical protein